MSLADALAIAQAQAMSRVCQKTAACLADLLRKSTPLAPIRTGTLRRSGYLAANGKVLARGRADGSVTTETHRFDVINGQVEFVAGFRAGYAAKQHEALYYRHSRGQAKFLEKPWTANKADYIREISSNDQPVHTGKSKAKG